VCYNFGLVFSQFTRAAIISQEDPRPWLLN
jgi:hypothetical protein